MVLSIILGIVVFFLCFLYYRQDSTIKSQIDTSGFTGEIKQLEIKTESHTKIKTDDYTTLEKIRYGID